MDYTKPEIRPLIYQDRDDIDLFDINDATALDAEMLLRIENSKIATFDGANKYILEIFNNAYYITTLIMMEKHPIHFFRKYITIAEHTGSVYKDLSLKNTYYHYFSSMIMAMVCNYLRLLDDRYSHKNILIQRIMEFFENESDTRILTGPYSLFSENALDRDDLKNYHINKESFQPRIVDAQAVYETNSKLNGMQKGWRGLTNDYNHKDITELLSICQNDEGKAVMADTIRREAEGYRCDETVDFIDSLDLPLTIDIESAVKKADVAMLRRYCLILMEQNSALKKQILRLSPQSPLRTVQSADMQSETTQKEENIAQPHNEVPSPEKIKQEAKEIAVNEFVNQINQLANELYAKWDHKDADLGANKGTVFVIIQRDGIIGHMQKEKENHFNDLANICYGQGSKTNHKKCEYVAGLYKKNYFGKLPKIKIAESLGPILGYKNGETVKNYI